MDGSLHSWDKIVITVAAYWFPFCQKVQNLKFGQKNHDIRVSGPKKDNFDYWFFASGIDNYCSMILWNPKKIKESNSKQRKGNVNERSEFVGWQRPPAHCQIHQGPFGFIWFGHFEPPCIIPWLRTFRFSSFHLLENLHG